MAISATVPPLRPTWLPPHVGLVFFNRGDHWEAILTDFNYNRAVRSRTRIPFGAPEAECLAALRAAYFRLEDDVNGR